MFTMLVFLVLAAGVCYFVAVPLLNARRGSNLAGRRTNHKANDLVERKETLYAAIKDIEFDYEMGKLSEEDFKELRQQYKDEAIGLLKQIDAGKSKPVKAKDVHASPEKTTKSSPKTEARFCWICGTKVTAADRYCANCGNKLDGET